MTSINENALGEFLKKLRGNINSLRTIAAKTEDKISHTKLDSIEKGKTAPSLEDLKILSIVYNHPYEEFLKVAGYIAEDNVRNNAEHLFNEYKKLPIEEQEKFLDLLNIK